MKVTVRDILIIFNICLAVYAIFKINKLIKKYENKKGESEECNTKD